MNSDVRADGRRAWQAFRWWHWLFGMAAVLIWTKALEWADSARHFGYELWPLLTVMLLVFISPIVAISDLARGPHALRSGSITLGGLWLRRAWAAALIINWCVIAWEFSKLSES